MGIITDITEQERMEEDKIKSEENYHNLVEMIPSGIMVLIEDKIVFANESMLKIMNATNTEDLLQKSIFDILDPSFHEIKKNRLERAYKYHLTNEYVQETFITLDGCEKLLEIRSSWVEYENKPAIFIIANDITELIQAQQEFQFLSTHDNLTKLIGRNEFERVLAAFIHSARLRLYNKFALFYINLDRFKIINDTFGLTVGDQMIQEVAERLKKSLRKADTLARIGGDEFGILLTQIGRKYDEISNLSEKLIKAMDEIFVIEGRFIKISASIGVAIYPDDGIDAKTLLDNAHIAMHSAKEMGGDTYKFFSQKLKGEILEASSIEKELREGLETNDFYLVYQPKISLKTGEITGLEALLRWKNPVGHKISTQEIIQLAEIRGFISLITNKVLDMICQQIVTWRDKSFPPQRIAINFSTHDFKNPRLLENFLSKLEAYHLEPSLFEIEITESVFFKEIEKNAITLQQFKNAGVKIAIDDFGVGYSSLSYLQNIKIDSIKIDRSFIKSLSGKTDASVLVETIIEMAHNLKLNVIAEGVETEEQLEYLRQIGCDEIQGFYAATPLTPEKLEQLIQNTKGHIL